MLPEGIYQAEIREWGFGESAEKKTPYFELGVILTEGKDEARNQVELPIPVRRRITFWLTPPAMETTAANLRSLGYADKNLDRLDPEHQEAFDLFGKQVEVKLSHEMYLGKPQEKLFLQRRRFKPSAEVSGFSLAAVAFEAAQKDADVRRSNKEEASPKSESEAVPAGTGSRRRGRRS